MSLPFENCQPKKKRNLVPSKSSNLPRRERTYLLLFHSKEFVDLVRDSSKRDEHTLLDYGDTPSFKGVYDASLFVVGSTLKCLKLAVEGNGETHFFNPVGGLHHARRERAGGFCVFNDCSIAMLKALSSGMAKVAYVDIDAHHGDGVFYGFESDPRIVIGDIHEDGRYLYPGTGFATETGKGTAKGTKLNIPLTPNSGDQEFIEAFDRLETFLRGFKPEMIFLQCGADGLEGDPITHLKYTKEAHSYATRKLHALAHELCDGRIIAMGGGGYNPENVEAAWSSVIHELRYL